MPRAFVTIKATQHLRNLFAELGTLIIPSSLSVPKIPFSVLEAGLTFRLRLLKIRFLRFVEGSERSIEAVRTRELTVYHIRNYKQGIM